MDRQTDQQMDERTLLNRYMEASKDFQSTLKTNQVPASGINLAFKLHQEAVDDNFQHTFKVVACDWLIQELPFRLRCYVAQTGKPSCI